MKQFKLGLLTLMLLFVSAVVYGTPDASPKVADEVSLYHYELTDVATPLAICQAPISEGNYIPIYRHDSAELPVAYILEAKITYLGFDADKVANRLINNKPLGYICISPQKAC
jgi:hypothetical protein